MFRLIVISSPAAVLHEAATINSLFDAGLELFHVRKPGMSAAELETLFQEINPVHRAKIALHQHHQLARQFEIRRLHFTEQQRLATSHEQLNKLKEQGYILSTSIHALKDHQSLPACFDYAFCGPVFRSISKQGYAPKESFEALEKKQSVVRLMAIGGITPGRIEAIRALGFDGAAMLGAIWNDPGKATHILRECYDQLKQAEPC